MGPSMAAEMMGFSISGGDWNHGMDYDFPETVGNGKSSQLTNSLHDFLEWGRLKPPTRNGCCLENHLHMEMFLRNLACVKITGAQSW